MTPAAILFPLALGLSGAQPESPPVLHCYAQATQIGTVARREFKNADGHVVKEIFYTSSLFEQRPKCAEDTLRVQSIRTYEHDAWGRPMIERVFGPDERLERLTRMEYEADERKPVRRSTQDPAGVLRSETRWDAGRQITFVQYDEHGRVALADGELPADLQYAIAWGPPLDGWVCGLGSTRTTGALPDVTPYVHLKNVGDDDQMARFVVLFDAEMRDRTGRTLPQRASGPATWRAISSSRLLRPGEAAHEYFLDLRRMYGRLPSGWYQLAVRHPHPDTGRMLDCGTLELQIK